MSTAPLQLPRKLFFLTRDDLVRPRGRWSGTWWRRCRNPTATRPRTATSTQLLYIISVPTIQEPRALDDGTTRTIPIHRASARYSTAIDIFYAYHFPIKQQYMPYDTIYNKRVQRTLSHIFYSFIVYSYIAVSRVSGQVHRVFFTCSFTVIIYSGP